MLSNVTHTNVFKRFVQIVILATLLVSGVGYSATLIIDPIEERYPEPIKTDPIGTDPIGDGDSDDPVQVITTVDLTG